MFQSRRYFQRGLQRLQQRQQHILFSHVEQFGEKRQILSTRTGKGTAPTSEAPAGIVGDIDRKTWILFSSRNMNRDIQDYRFWRPRTNLCMTNNVIIANYNSNYSHYNFTTKARWYSSNIITREYVLRNDGENDTLVSTRCSGPQEQDLRKDQRRQKANNNRNKYNNKKKKKNQSGRILPYHRDARMILSQIKNGTIPSQLIPQRVELCLESFLKYEHNESSKTSSPSNSYSSLLPSDGRLARRLLDAVITYRRSSPDNHVDTMPRLFSLCCQIVVRSGHTAAIDRLPNLLEHVLLKEHEKYFARHATGTTPTGGNNGINNNDNNSVGRVNSYDVHQANPRERQGQQQGTANTTTINKHGALAYNTHHVNDACKAYINHVVVTNEKVWKQQRYDYNKTDYNKQMQQVDRILKKLEQLYNDPNIPLLQSPRMSEAIILLLCHQRRPYDAYRILQLMVENASSAAGKAQQDHDGQDRRTLTTIIPASESLMPSVTSFTTTISGFAKIGNVEMAREVIQWMLSSNHNNSNNNNNIPPPNRTCFNALLHAYAIKGGKDAGEKAEQTIRWMGQLHDVDGFDTNPDEISYNTVIDAFAKSKSPDAPIRAERILKELLWMHEQGLFDVPSEEAFTSTMNAWSSSRRDDAPARVEALIDLMEALNDETNFAIQNRNIAYSILIKTWEMKASLSNVSSQNRQRCADGILAVVARMKSKDIRPAAVTNNAILTALSATSPLNAIMYFLQLEQAFRNDNSSVELCTKAFNSALNAIADLNRPDAMDRATEIFDRMMVYSSPEGKGTYDKQSANVSIRPSLATYNIMLKVLSRSTTSSTYAAEKADALLVEMGERSHISPDFISFLTTILAWGRSDSMDKFQRVDDIIRRFAARYQQSGRSTTTNSFSQEDLAVFNTALSVCSHNSNPDLVKASIATASLVISKMRQIKELKADERTYFSFFAFVHSVHTFDSELIRSSDALEQLIRGEFTACIRDGLVSNDIWKMVRRTSPKLWVEATNNLNVDPDSESSYTIPNSWYRNIELRGEKK